MIFVITAVVQLLRTRLVETRGARRAARYRSAQPRRAQRVHHPALAREHRRRRRRGSDPLDQRVGDQAARRPAAQPGELDLAARLARAREPAAPLAQRRNVDRTQMAFSSPDGTNIQPHFAPLASGRDGGVVIFLEDTSLIAERVQQAKLAALGRLSASIAHEIRNPLGAMSHAGQLLAESPSMGKDEHRLTDIIRVERAPREPDRRERARVVAPRSGAPRKPAARPVGRGFHARVRADARALRGRRDADAGPRRTSKCAWIRRTCIRSCGTSATTPSSTRAWRPVRSPSRSRAAFSSRRAGRISRSPTAARASSPTRSSRSSSRSTRASRAARASASIFLASSRSATAPRYATSRAPGGGSAFRIVFADPKRWQPGEDPS